MNIQNKRIGIASLFMAMLIIGTVFVPAASAQENLKKIDELSELQQGLIDTLNCNTKKLSTDKIVSNYCNANKDKISKNSFVSNNSSAHQLKDGSKISFTKEGYILIGSLKEEANNNMTQPINKKSEMSSKSLVYPAYTDTLTYTVNWYNCLGSKVFSVHTQGYFGYDYNAVEAYHLDSWYTKYIIFNPWQVSNWEEGAQPTSSSTAQVYGSGRFSWGYTVAGNYFEVQNKYIKVYITCNKYGQHSGGYIDN